MIHHVLMAGLIGSAAVMSACSADPMEPMDSADPTGAILRYEWEGNISRASLPEPSGAVLHPGRRTLFIVGDEGAIFELTRDGELLHRSMLEQGADLEGVTCNPATGLLYVAVEGREQIWEVDPETLGRRRVFQIQRAFHNARGQPRRLDPAGEGIESIAFVPEPDRPEGGSFLVANQAFTLDDPDDPSELMRVRVPLGSVAAGSGPWPATVERAWDLPVIDIAGLTHQKGKRVFAVADSPNALLMLEVGRKMRLLKVWTFPGNDQEGLALTSEGTFYVAQDSGGVIRFRWKNKPGDREDGDGGL